MIVDRISKSTRRAATSSIRSRFDGLITSLLHFCYAASVIGVIAVPSYSIEMLPAESAGEPTIYYLSPQVLTRTRMAPDHLKRDSYRRENADLPRQEIEALSARIRSTQHNRAGEPASQYDFRLCVASESDSTCFSANGGATYFHNQVFLLSGTETAAVLKVFGELDSFLYPPKKKP